MIEAKARERRENCQNCCLECGEVFDDLVAKCSCGCTRFISRLTQPGSRYFDSAHGREVINADGFFCQAKPSIPIPRPEHDKVEKIR
jgi:hypothetical protein